MFLSHKHSRCTQGTFQRVNKSCLLIMKGRDRTDWSSMPELNLKQLRTLASSQSLCSICSAGPTHTFKQAFAQCSRDCWSLLQLFADTRNETFDKEARSKVQKTAASVAQTGSPDFELSEVMLLDNTSLALYVQGVHMRTGEANSHLQSLKKSR